MALFSFISRLDNKERRFEIISLVLLAVLLLLTPVIWSIVPDKVLILQQDTGALDSYNNKSALWLFPLIGVVIYAALSIIKHYLIKYREAPAPGEEPEHTTTVWVLRLVKMIAMAGLIISVLEVWVAAAKGSPAAMAGIVLEVLIVAALFTIVFIEVMAKYGKRG